MAQFLDERLPARFWSKVIPEPNSGCWLWLAALSEGYGSLGRGKRSAGTERAHRMAYMTLVGPVPAGLELDHKCRTRICCNPQHLEPVTRRINLLRGDTVTARCAAATHCPKGHAYDTANTIVVSVRRGRGKGRKCRACNQARCAAVTARRKAA